jgi:hypothetical protein
MGNRTGIGDLGWFDGDVWRFHEPFTTVDGHVVETIDFTEADLPISGLMPCRAASALAMQASSMPPCSRSFFVNL